MHNESLYHTIGASKEILVQEAKIMDSWMQAYEVCDVQYAYHVVEDILIEEKELGVKHERD